MTGKTIAFRLLGIGLACAVFFAGGEALTQGWGGSFDRGYDPRQGGGYDPRPYPPNGPVYGDPGGYPPQGPQSYPPPRPVSPSSTNPRCRELEFQLAGGWAQNVTGQDQLPRIENDLRAADAAFQRARIEAERADCYEDMFLFGRSLKRTPRCIDLDQQVQNAKNQVAQLKSQRDMLARGASSPRARRDDIIAELARNRCGDIYVQEYERQRSRSASVFSFFSDEEPDDGRNPYSVAGSTYQTKCVRLCDGFYFPVSYSTLQTHFQEDEGKCQSQCAAPSELYVHRVDEDVETMVSLSGRPYKSLPNAFRNRKEYIKGCSCKQNEYSPELIAKSEEMLKQQNSGKRADAGSKIGVEGTARTASNAQSQPGVPQAPGNRAQ